MPLLASVSLRRVPRALSGHRRPQLRDVCGEDPGFFCREVFERTEDRALAEIADTVLGTPLTIVAILIGALIVNRLVGRAIKRALRSAALRRRARAARARCAAAPRARCWRPTTSSLRAEQRINALTSVLRSVASFVIFTLAGLLILGEVGLNLAPLLAGAGIVGIALGFGAQSLVKDFLSGLFILVEDQFGVGDIVDLDAADDRARSRPCRCARRACAPSTAPSGTCPTATIRRVGNKSQHWSRALLDVEVAYDTDIEHAKARHQARRRRAVAGARRHPRRARRSGASSSSARTRSSSGWSSRRARPTSTPSAASCASA